MADLKSRIRSYLGEIEHRIENLNKLDIGKIQYETKLIHFGRLEVLCKIQQELIELLLNDSVFYESEIPTIQSALHGDEHVVHCKG